MKTLLFMGGTSFFGKLAVQRLLEDGQYRITLLTRGNRIPGASETGVSLIRCDRTNRDELGASLRGRQFDVVVDNIASNGHDVRALLDVMRGNVGHYLLCSSAGVYPAWHTPHHWIETEAVLEPVLDQIPYANGKREAEKELMERGDVPFTIYRPTVVEGPEDPVERTRYFVENVYHQKHFIVPDDVILQHVYSADVAEAILGLISSGPDNRAYNITGNDNVPIGTYCDMISELLKKPKCHELVARDRFMASHGGHFPGLFDQTLLLSNAALFGRVRYHPTSIQKWLPITVQWDRDHYCESKTTPSR